MNVSYSAGGRGFLDSANKC